MHSESDLYTRPPITTSHRRTEDDIVCRPQLPRGAEPAFCISPSSVRKSIWYWLPRNTDTLLSLWVSFSHSTHPTRASPYTKFPEFPRLACHSHSHPPVCIYMPFSIPPCGHLKLPMLRSWKHLYIYSISARFFPSSQCYASFIRGTGWPIFSVWPRAAIVHRCSTPSCSLSHWPQAAAVGVAALLN